MFKIAILGCDNSHGQAFSKIFTEEYPDVEIVGIYGVDEPSVTAKLAETYGLYVAKSYDEFVGKVDGIMITSRIGPTHYEYAKPYIKSGIPMFIDKPVSWEEEEAVEFMKELRDNGVRIMGGSSIPYNEAIIELKEIVSKLPKEEVYGGYFRSPANLIDKYGNYFFYAAHLTQSAAEIFGTEPDSVFATATGNMVSVMMRYDGAVVTLENVDNNYYYYASVSTKGGVIARQLTKFTGSNTEAHHFYELLSGKEQTVSYRDFIKPVFTMTAIDRSLKSKKEEKVREVPEI